MVRIAKKDFNKEMDEYLETRKYSDGRERLLTKIKRLFPEKKDDYKRIDLEPEEEVEEPEQEEMVEEPEEEVPQEKRRGFMAWIFGWRNEEGDEFEEVVVEENDEREEEIEELKEVVRILHGWLEKLPKDELNKFRRSEDFQRYKDALDRLGLLKKD